MRKRLIIFLQLTPAILSLLLIGAHLFRAGHWLLVPVCLLLIGSLVAREPVVVRVVQTALLLATAEWLRSAYVLASARLEMGDPWIRLVAIIGGVVLISFISIFLFYTQSLKERYHLGEEPIDSNLHKKSVEPTAMAEAKPASSEFIKIHNTKIALNALSPLLFILMDFFMGIGLVALAGGVGLGNSFLRKKMNAAGGTLSPDEKKISFFKQTIPMLALAGAVMVYFYISTEFLRVQVVILSVITFYTLFICSTAYLEYIYDSDSNR